MADKRIKITTDVSSLRMIRDEVTGLTNEINNLSRASSSAFKFDQEAYDSSIRTLRDEISLVGSRSNFGPDPKRIPTSPTTPTRETISPREEREEQTRETTPSRREERPLSSEELRDRIRMNQEDLSELREQRKTVDKSTEEGQEYYTNLTNEINRLTQSNIELTNVLREQERRGFEPREETTSSPEGTNQERVRETTRGSRRDYSVSFRQINQSLSSILSLAEERNRLLGGQEVEDRGQTGNVSPTIIPIAPTGTRGGGTIAPEGRREVEERRPSRLAQLGTGTTSILVQGAVESLGQVANARNSYESGAGIVGAIGQSAGGLVGSIGNAFGPIGGMIGGIVGGAVSGLSSIVSSYMSRAVGKLEEQEGNSRLYAQTSGQSLSQVRGQGYEEGSFAARGLGLNVGEYMQRRAELLRAAGGKTLGATEEDTGGVREANSLLAVQRGMGLSDQALSSLQGTMRFATRGETPYGSSSNSPSGIIRLFENTMKELKMPFSEIASTMEESLSTFNRVAERTLEKAGEFDAGKLATVMSTIRQGTGMEGRQLERVQMAVTGQTTSQDPVTQALLMRVAREVHPEAETYPELMAKIDEMATDQDLQVAFLKRIQDMSGEGNMAQLQSMLKAVFTNLSWRDVVDFTKGGLDIDKLLPKINAPETVKGNEGKYQYDQSYGSRTVGAVEASTKEKDNRDAANGGKFLESLNRIDAAVAKMVGNSDAVVTGISKISELLEIISKIGDLNISEEQKKALKMYAEGAARTAASVTNPTAVVFQLAEMIKKYVVQ